MVEPKDPSLGASGPEGDARVGRPLLIAARFRRKAKGLLFSPEHAGALLLAPCNDVHTAGMRHRLDIAFVDAQGLVLEAHRDVGPCRRLRNKSAEAVVERFSSCATPWFTARGSGLHERRSEMKTCPTCGARAFDDAEVCFGCLHRYEEEPVRPNVAMPTMPSSPGTGHCPTLRPKAAPAEPKAPPRDGAGWTVRFELPGYAPVMEADGREGGVVVRFQPSDEAGGAGDGGRRVPRGTHARDAPSENHASASAAGRS